MYRLAILGNCCTHGAGAAGLKNRPDVEIVTGYEPDPRRGPELAAAIGAPLVADVEEIFADPAIDIVVVTTDPCDKAEMVERAGAAGKHIFLNKPLCHDLAAARRIVRAVEAAAVTCVFDIPMVKFLPLYAKFKDEVRAGAYGRPVHYAHSFGMTFPFDFPITDLWPERFDPPEVAGGGEMTNMGCYALDYVVTLFGKPQAVAAKWHHFWEPYRTANVENFGQILLNYGGFYALLAVGKQTLGEPRQGSNTLTVQFEHHNFVLDPYTDTFLLNGIARNVVEYLGDYRVESSFDQLLRGLETGAEPESSVQVGADGVEVLMAAYRSIRNGGAWVPLEKEKEGNERE